MTLVLTQSNGHGCLIRFTYAISCLSGRRCCGSSCQRTCLCQPCVSGKTPAFTFKFYSFPRKRIDLWFTDVVVIHSWGAAAMSSGAARNMGELIVTRCFLGVFEAAFGSGAPYFLSLLYKRQELGFRMSILLGTMPLANTFASSLAYGITQIRGSLEPWRLLFIIGIVACSFSCVSSHNTCRYHRLW